jgi:carotenoid cleavage dioxygenase
MLFLSDPRSPARPARGYQTAIARGHRRVLQYREARDRARRKDAAVRESEQRNPWLVGNFAPVRREVSVENLPVSGALPPELDGVYARNGPNPQFPPWQPYHWFDGDGMVHAVRLRAGQASYTNRWVRTLGWQREHAAGRALWGGLLTPPAFDNPDGPFKNPANTALLWHARRLLALWEGGEPYALRLPTLDAVGPYTFGGRWPHPFTAHPKLDAATGELHFFGYHVGEPPYLWYGVADAHGEVVHTTPIDLPAPVMMHDFALTERHVVFLDLPFVFAVERLLAGEPPLVWAPERGARLGVLPRRGDGAAIRWFAVAPGYVFHVLNAFEQDDALVVDGCRYPRMGFGLTGADGAADAPAVLYRWRLDLRAGTVQERALDDRASEFPRVADRLVGRPARYGYAALFAPDGGVGMAAGLVKYDLLTGRDEVHRHGAGRGGGEGVFVPRPGAIAEDDGWVVTFVYDAASDTSELVLIAAQDFAAPPVARVHLPQRVPWGLHGCWIPSESLV